MVHDAPDTAEGLAGGVGAGIGGGAVDDLVGIVDVAAGVGVRVEDEVAHGSVSQGEGEFCALFLRIGLWGWKVRFMMSKRGEVLGFEEQGGWLVSI